MRTLIRDCTGERGTWSVVVALLLLCPAGAGCGDVDSTREPVVVEALAEMAAPTAKLIPDAAWLDPPHELRPVARWWWPGGSVDTERLRTQLEQIERAGFGGVEIQPLLLGLGVDDLAADPRLRTVGEPAFRSLVANAAVTAAELDLAFDLTMGSGWPGGLPTAKLNAERQLLMASVDVEGPTRFTGPLPPAPDQSYRGVVEWVLDVLGPRDPEVRLVAALAARVGDERNGLPTLHDIRVISRGEGADIDWPIPTGPWRLFVFYENSTEHFVMGGAFPGAEADARVVDHLSRRGADALLDGYGAPLLDAVAPGAVRDLFVDSFEQLGELPFTSELLAEFETRMGYDLTPHLPLVFRSGGESKYGEMIDFLGRYGGHLYLAPELERAERIREDYEAVRASLFEEHFVARFRSFAHARGLGLRLQAHGGYSDYLDVYALADVPESEALFGGGSFDFLKLAASSAHVMDRRWASSESFITLRFFGTTLSDEEMRLLAGRAYSAGINRLAFHGVPYPYERVDGEVWFPFSGGFGRILAGPLPMSSEIDADFLSRLPDFNRFLGRLSLAMSTGDPAAEIAWLRADGIFPDEASPQIGRVTARAGESSTTAALRGLGLTHDRISRRMLASARASATQGGFEVGARRYRALLLDPLAIAEPELVERVLAIARAGVPVLALGTLPARAPGWGDAAARDERVAAATESLSGYVKSVSGPEKLASALEQAVRPEVVGPEPSKRLSLSIERRTDPAGDLVLLFNESWSSGTERLRISRDGGAMMLWDPRDGTRRVLRNRVAAGDVVEIAFEPAEALLLTLEALPSR